MSFLIRFLGSHVRMNLSHLFQKCNLSLPLENIKKPQGFLMFSGGREMVHWKEMGQSLVILPSK